MGKIYYFLKLVNPSSLTVQIIQDQKTITCRSLKRMIEDQKIGSLYTN